MVLEIRSLTLFFKFFYLNSFLFLDGSGENMS